MCKIMQSDSCTILHILQTVFAFKLKRGGEGGAWGTPVSTPQKNSFKELL